jgi:hypothetical protein
MAARVLLLTGADMPVPDPESGLLVDALAAGGVHAELVPWDAAPDWSASPDPTAAELAVSRAVLAAAPQAAAYARIDLVATASGPLLMEAELIDPELFLPQHPDAASRFADVLVDELARCAAGGAG